jgi:hypothetical protein
MNAAAPDYRHVAKVAGKGIDPVAEHGKTFPHGTTG